MTPVESAINLSIMCHEEGVQFIYDLANSKAPQKLKTIALKEMIEGYIFGVVAQGAYEIEENEEIQQNENAEPNEFLNTNFLNTMFGSILHPVNWGVIIDYHKEHKELDTRSRLC